MPCAVMSAQSPSTAQHIQGENLARLAFRHDLEGAAADLAVRRELLRGLAGVGHQLEALPAKGALHGFGQLHSDGWLLESRAGVSPARRARQREPCGNRLIRLATLGGAGETPALLSPRPEGETRGASTPPAIPGDAGPGAP